MSGCSCIPRLPAAGGSNGINAHKWGTSNLREEFFFCRKPSASCTGCVLQHHPPELRSFGGYLPHPLQPGSFISLKSSLFHTCVRHVPLRIFSSFSFSGLAQALCTWTCSHLDLCKHVLAAYAPMARLTAAGGAPSSKSPPPTPCGVGGPRPIPTIPPPSTCRSTSPTTSPTSATAAATRPPALGGGGASVHPWGNGEGLPHGWAGLAGDG